ncbi:hypothetical protein POTOM_060089 [Populus tomentosa]|uniref:Uncharacterized protein n=1 Tax=Populus tomentosa TaxID=118781 RepID=A0A8X7XSE8_POPTO|nr:hypothetical protein POTOM_060089 [Populus tomentosa]
MAREYARWFVKVVEEGKEKLLTKACLETLSSLVTKYQKLKVNDKSLASGCGSEKFHMAAEKKVRDNFTPKLANGLAQDPRSVDFPNAPQSTYSPIEEAWDFFKTEMPNQAAILITLFHFIHVDEPPSFSILVDNSPVTMFRPVEQKCFLISESNTTLDDPVLTVNEIEDISDWLVSESSPPALHNFPGDDAASLLMEVSIGTLMNQTSLILPGIGMEFDNQLSILYLLKAYGEAEETETKELAEKIMSRLKEKAFPFSSIVERLAHYMIQALEC